MTGATFVNQNAGGIYQENYLDMVEFVVNIATPISRRVERARERFEGKRLRKNIGYGMPSKGGAVGTLEANRPSAGRSRNFETIGWAVQIADTIEVDTFAAAMSKGSHSYISVESQEMARVAQWRGDETERQWLNDGTGVLGGGPGTAATGSFGIGALTVTALAPLTITLPEYLTPRFKPGSMCEFFNVGAAVTGTANDYAGLHGATRRDHPVAGGFEVAAANPSAATGLVTVTFTETAAGNVPATNDYVARMGAIEIGTGPSGRNVMREPIGFKGMIDDGFGPLLAQTDPADYPATGTFQGVSPTTLGAVWQSPTIDGTGSGLTRDLVARAYGRVKNYGVGSVGGVRMIVTNEFQQRAYMTSLAPNEVFQTPPNDTSNFNTGPEWLLDDERGPMVAGLPTMYSRYCDIDKCYGVGDGIYEFESEPWDFLDIGGAIWWPAQSGRMSREATAYKICSWMMTKRNNHFRIEGLNVS